jgi:hypothetical protein
MEAVYGRSFTMRDLRMNELSHVYGAGGKGCYTPPSNCGSKGSKSKASKSKKCKSSKSKKHSKGWC